MTRPCLLLSLLLCGSPFLTAQQKQTVPAKTRTAAAAPVGARSASADTPEKLPVRRVVLYKNGVGYFEHLGRVHG